MQFIRCLLFAFALCAGFAPAAQAADMSRTPAVTSGEFRALPFPRSERAQAVWEGGLCWSQCGSYCTAALDLCLRDTPAAGGGQGDCLKTADRCDRSCQRQCRSSGGPLVSFELPWE